MGREEAKSCLLCGNPEIGLAQHPTRAAYDITCRRCGHFTVSRTLYVIKEVPEPLKHGLSAHTREITEAGATPEILSTANIEALARPYVQAPPIEKLEHLLEVFARRSAHPGTRVTFDPDWDYPLAYAKNAEESAYHREELLARGWIQTIGLSTVVVTHEGWEHIQEAEDHRKKSLERSRYEEAKLEAKASGTEWDTFICHAGEDKAEVVEPLARGLDSRGLKVWYDRWELEVGDSLRRKIDEGLAKSRYGIVVISPSFLKKKPWTEKELDGLVQKEIDGRKVILPVWHKVTHKDVAQYSLTLADKIAASTERGIASLADELEAAIRPRATESGWTRASKEELAEILSYIARPSPDVRAEGARQLLNLSYKMVLTDHEPFLAAVDLLLKDDDPIIRTAGLRILAAAITRMEPSRKPAVVSRYADELLRLVQQDRDLTVRAQAMMTIGQTGDSRFIEWLLAFICNWDPDTYSRVGPVVALNGLASIGLAKVIRGRVLQALEGAITDEQRSRLRECLNSVNQINT